MAPGGSSCTTEWEGGAITIVAEPFYLAEQSGDGEHVFGYRIEVFCDGPADGPSCRLLWRRWTITDGTGNVREVQGSGVVGQQPTLSPGERFEYRSFCPLPTPTGTMAGTFTFQGLGGRMFEVGVAPFEFSAVDPEPDRERGR